MLCMADPVIDKHMAVACRFTRSALLEKASGYVLLAAATLTQEVNEGLSGCISEIDTKSAGGFSVSSKTTLEDNDAADVGSTSSSLVPFLQWPSLAAIGLPS